MLSKFFRVAAAGFLLLVLGCSGGSHSRGQFHGHVVGSTGEQIEQKLGKPEEGEAKDPNKPRWIYKNKTFDPDNFNQVDPRAIVILERNAEGKLIGRDVLYGS